MAAAATAANVTTPQEESEWMADLVDRLAHMQLLGAGDASRVVPTGDLDDHYRDDQPWRVVL